MIEVLLIEGGEELSCELEAFNPRHFCKACQNHLDPYVCVLIMLI